MNNCGVTEGKSLANWHGFLGQSVGGYWHLFQIFEMINGWHLVLFDVFWHGKPWTRMSLQICHVISFLIFTLWFYTVKLSFC